LRLRVCSVGHLSYECVLGNKIAVDLQFDSAVRAGKEHFDSNASCIQERDKEDFRGPFSEKRSR
jgi:hypothetical protein